MVSELKDVPFPNIPPVWIITLIKNFKIIITNLVKIDFSLTLITLEDE